METAAYGGVFLAPESIVVCPGLPAFVLNEDPRTRSMYGVNDSISNAVEFSAAATGEGV